MPSSAASGAENAAETKRPLRLLMTTDAVGGVWQYSLDLIREVGAVLPLSVLLVNLGPEPSALQRAQAEGLPGVTLQCRNYALEWMNNPWGDVDASGQWLLQLGAEWGADLAHLNGYSHAALPWTIPTVVVAHSCVLSWWNSVHGSDAPSEWDEYARRVRKGLGSGTQVIAPSRFMRDALHCHYGVDRQSVRVIHNFSGDAPEAPTSEKAKGALAVGRMWDPAKNLELLRRIAGEVSFPIRVAGKTDSPDGSENQTGSLHFLGQLGHRELLEQMSSAQVFLHPARYEPFGLAVLEAARAGCCLVLADIPSLRELWDGAALFLDRENEGQWIHQLNTLFTDPALVGKWSERSRQHARRYTAAASAAQYASVYTALTPAVANRNGSGVAA